jgi:hypothetical protein
MIPPVPERGLLPGSAADVSAILESEDSRREFVQGVARITELAESVIGTPIEGMNDALFQDFLTRARTDLDSILRTVGPVLLKAYYTHPLVKAALGAGAGAPFPSGSRVYDGNLELLEPVYNRGQIYRNVDSER